MIFKEFAQEMEYTLMNEKNKSHNFVKQQSALRKLSDDVANVDRHADIFSAGDKDMLSLIVSDALMGIDISKRYPTFYKKLLGDATLRQAFIDSLEMMEKSNNNELITLPSAIQKELTFLAETPFSPKITDLGENKWQIRWHQTVKQLQSVFFPPDLGLAYRADPNLLEDTCFTLLRGDVDFHGKVYSLQLECGIAENVEDALATFLHLAVTFESKHAQREDPLLATLVWGKYGETLEILNQGRVRFPDIPLTAALDEERRNIISDLSLTIEPSSRAQVHESRR